MNAHRERSAGQPEAEVRKLVTDVAAVAAAEGSAWFPELGTGSLDVRYEGGVTRSRCFLHRFELQGPRGTRPLMVKVRHSEPALRRSVAASARPVLAPVRTMGDRETGRREYDGLVLIRDALVGRITAESPFGVLRPLAWLPEHAALVTDFVREPTLRSVVLGTSRLNVRKGPPVPDQTWHNAGAWLRLFHDHPAPPDLALSPRNGTRAEVARLLRQYTEYLRDRMGPRPLFRELGDAAGDLVRDALPAEMPLRTAHGDYVANNMFAGPAGRITVFDPLPVWRTPVHQDLATLTVGLRVVWTQVMTGGLAIPRQDLERYEAALYRGYWGEQPAPLRELRVFQLLALLDRWSAVASTRPRSGSVRSRARRARIHLATRHYAREVRRVIAELAG